MSKRVLIVVVLLSVLIVGCGETVAVQNHREPKRLARLITEMPEVKTKLQNLVEHKEIENAVVFESEEQKPEIKETKDEVQQVSTKKVMNEENELSSNETIEENIEKNTISDSISDSNMGGEEQAPDVETEDKPDNTTLVHEHMWNQHFVEYNLIQAHIYGCNGCGYPLFMRTEKGIQFIDDLYFHPPYATDCFEGECNGGGFHNEYYTSGFCVECGDKVSYRQCMWTENGKRCIKNKAAGPYEKVEYDQNYFMYFDVCGCGSNRICESGDQPQQVLILDKKICSICGMEKTE